MTAYVRKVYVSFNYAPWPDVP